MVINAFLAPQRPSGKRFASFFQPMPTMQVNRSVSHSSCLHNCICILVVSYCLTYLIFLHGAESVLEHKTDILLRVIKILFDAFAKPILKKASGNTEENPVTLKLTKDTKLVSKTHFLVDSPALTDIQSLVIDNALDEQRSILQENYITPTPLPRP